MNEALLTFSWSRWVAEAAVSGLWQGMVLAIVAWAALRLAPRTSATVRFLVWTGVLLGALILPFVHGAASSSSAMQPRTVRLGAGWSLGIAALWAVISMVRLGLLVGQGIRLGRLWREARRISDSELSPQVKSALGGLVLRKVDLCATSSESVDRPSVIGFFAPKILVPDWLLQQLSNTELEQIVLHEMEHLRRGDDWLNLVQKLCLAVSPLNPALVWIERKLCRERELACDDGVLQTTSAPTVYARCLTMLAEKSLERRSFGLASLALGILGAFARESELSRRVYGILYRKPGLSPMLSRAVATLVILGLVGAGTELARSPELVSFAGPNESAGSFAAVDSNTRGMDRVLGASAGGAYRDVVFPANGATGAPRMSLLKAVMPDAAANTGLSDHPSERPIRQAKALDAIHRREPSSALQSKAPESKQTGVQTNISLTGDPNVGLPAASSTHATLPPSIGPVAALPVMAMASNGDKANIAPAGAGWIVMTSFEWENGQSVGFVRSTQVIQTAQRMGGQQPLSTGVSQAASASRQSNGLATPNSAPEPVETHPVFVRYAAVPTDMGWLLVQL